jgi:uncharacterized protein YcaQ
VRIPNTLSPSAARRVALAAQGFADRRPAAGVRVDVRHVRRALARAGVVQIDSVNVLVRSHELPLFSRLGLHSRTLLPRLAYGPRRELFEYWAHEASYVPVELHPLLRWRMARARTEAWGRMARINRERPDLVRRVVAELADRGPLAASELSVGRRGTGSWWGWGEGKTALEWLLWSGEVTATGRGANFERTYDLTERALPPSVLAMPTPDEPGAKRELLRFAAARLGIGTARDLADYFRLRMPDARPRLTELVEEGTLLPVRVDGWREPAFLDRGAVVPSRALQAWALLSPFDSLVWERARVERLFGMRLRLEVYTPAAKRVHGYYVLPFLLGEHLVARVDLKADRKSRRLLVLAAHAEPDHPAGDVAGPLAAELGNLAAWLGLDAGIVVIERGDLAPALTAEVGARPGGLQVQRMKDAVEVIQRSGAGGAGPR